MSVSRRAFLSGLATMLGATSTDSLTRKIQDLGRPILLNSRKPENFLHVFNNGLLMMGNDCAGYNCPRPTWRQLFAEEGLPIHDPAEIPRILANKFMEPDELDEAVPDVCWPMAYETTWSPMARAARFLEKLKIGPRLRSGSNQIGRLDFHYGDNHPGSSEIWVEAEDDLSVSLLQARLIELDQPVQVVMQVPTIVKEI